MDENVKQQIESKEQGPFEFMIDLEKLQGDEETKKKAVEEFRQKQAEYYADKDAAIIKKAVDSGTKYLDGLKELRAGFKKKFQRCFKGEDGVYRSFPYVIDHKNGWEQGVLVAGNGRYTLVTYTGYCYSIRHNHCMYVAHSPKTLDEAIGYVQDFIYGERW